MLLLTAQAAAGPPAACAGVRGDGARLVCAAAESGLIYNRGPNRGDDKHDWRQAPGEPGRGDGPRN